MTTANTFSPTDKDSALRQRALREALFWTGVNFFAASIALVLALQTQIWQLSTLAGASWAVVGFYLICVALIRRGHVELGAWLTIGGVWPVIVLMSLLISGLGLILGFALVLVTLMSAIQILPPNQHGRATTASAGAGIIVALVDVLGSPDRLEAPEAIQTLVPLLAGIMVLALSFWILRQFASYALRTKLLVVFLLVALLPLALLSLSNIAVMRSALIDGANQVLSVASSETAARIDSFIQSNLDAVEVEAELPALLTFLNLTEEQRSGSAKEEARLILRILKAKNRSDISSYALLDLTGRNVLDTLITDIGKDESDRDYFVFPTTVGQRFVSPVEFYTPDEPAIYFSMPVIGTFENIVGVLRIRYKHDVLRKLVQESSGEAGEDSFGVLFDEYNIHLVHTTAPDTEFMSTIPLDPEMGAALQVGMRLNPDLPVAEQSLNLPELSQSLDRAVEQPFFTAEDVATGERLNQVAVTPLKTQPWLMAFLQPQDVFLAPIDEQIRNTIFFALIIVGVVSAAAIFGSQIFVAPIVRLTEVASRVSEGDLSVQAQVESDDEIGTLATTFNTMTAQMRVMIASLESQVEARTAQFQASADVGRAVASILDTEQLLEEIVNLITDRFGFYYASVFTLDRVGRYAVLRRASGEAGKVLKQRGHKLKVGGESMVGDVIAQRKLRVALDVGEEAVRFANPLLPETRSEIALPLIVGERVLGALDVQSTHQAAFDETNAAVLQSMADQIAIALNNASFYAQSQHHIVELNGLLELSQQLARSRTLRDISEHALQQIETIIGTDTYYVALIDEQLTTIDFVLQRRPDYDEPVPRVERPFGNGRTEYVITTGQTLNMTAAQAPAVLKELGLKTWEEHPGAFLGVPIIAGERVLGMLGLQDFDEDAAFDEHQEELATVLGSQLAVTLENLRLGDETRHALAELDAANRRLSGEAWEQYSLRHTELSGEWRGGRWLKATEESGSGVDTHVSQTHHLTIPIRVRGEMVGEFELFAGDEQREWTPHDLTFAQSLIDQVGQTIENARLLEETERLAGREHVINEINSRVRQTVNMDTILKTAVNELGRSLKATCVFVRLDSTADGDTAPADNGKED